MASATTRDDEKAMATDVIASAREDDRDDDRDDRDDEGGQRPEQQQPKAPAERKDREGGFFHIYKKGQGYWTRMGTAAAAGLIIVGVAAFMYENLTVWFPYFTTHRGPLVGVVLAVAGALALLAYWLMNKAGNVDFLIATDSEMQKVNWTSRKDLIGSTKVVVAFMFFIAFFLAVCDVALAGFFQLIGVLKGGGHTLFGG